MANSSLVYRSSITTSNIKKSLSGLETGVKNSQKTSNSISQSLIRRNEQKRQAISVKSTLFLKRQEAVRRRDQEDIVEAGSVFGGVRRAQRVVMNSTKGFMGRILDYIGTLLVGWAVINLPTIISMAKQLGTRIQKLTGILTTFMSDTKDFMLGFGQLLGGVFQNVVSFDFTDSQGRLTSGLNEMKQAFQRMEDSIYEGIVLLTKPIDFGIPEDVTQEEEKPPGGTQPPGGVSGGNPDFWLLALISLYENSSPQGAADVAQSIYNRMGYSGRTSRQVILSPGQYEPVGKFGKTSEWNKVVDRDTAIAHIKKYPGNGASISGLDSVAAALTNTSMQQSAAKFIGNRPDFRSEGFEKQYDDMTNDATRYGQTFGFNKGSAYLGKSNAPAPIPDLGATSFQPGKPGTKPLRPGDVLTESIGRGVSYIQIGDVIGADRGGGRKHAGIDIQCPSGTYIALRADSEVMFAGWQNPNNHNEGYGLVIDLWVPELGVQLRFGHCSGFLVNSGKVKAGRSFARVGSTGNSSGPHIHFEYSRNRNQSGYGSDGDPSPYVPFILLTNKPNNVPFSTPANTTAAAPGSISINNVQTQERRLKGETKDNVITVPLPSSQQRNTAMLPVGGAPSVTMMSDDELNRFITQKLLLDLAYT